MATIDVSELMRAAVEPVRKRARPADDTPSGSGQEADAAGILAALEEAAEAVIVDESLLKRLLAQLEKKTLKNREMRIKHVDDPQKFMESEVDLNVAIQELNCLAAQQEFFPLFISLKGPELLVSLLAHENSDIVGAVLNLLKELVEDDGESEGSEDTLELVDALLKVKIVESVVGALSRLDENLPDDAEAVHNALAVVEAMLELREEVSSSEAVSNAFFQWLLRRACQRGLFDPNKLYASELLALIMQSCATARMKLTEKVDGMDLLLRALAAYKKHDPSSSDEHEYMENVFNALCASLLQSENRSKFLEGEGLQLMNLMLRERKKSRQSALKVLDHATSGPEGKHNCAKFVEILGLRTLFPLFMRTPAKAKRKDTTPDEHEEHVCAILTSLMKSCEDEARVRIIQKFVEHEHEKVDRALELLLKYKEKVDKWERKRICNSGETPDEVYLDKLDAGLYTQQNLALLLSQICSHSNSARLRAIKLFKLKTGEQRLTKHFLPILVEYQANLGLDADGERDRVDILIAKLTAAEKADAAAHN